MTRSDPDDSERAAIEAARADRSRFADLYEDNFERLYAYVLRRVRHREEAQDVTAEVFKRALAHLDRYEWRGVPFSAWLFRIAANAIADRAHRCNETGLPDTFAAGGATLEEIEERARVFRMVDQLPDDQRRVVVMRFAEQRTIKEIASVLGRSEGAVKQLQFRALQFMRERLGGPE